MPGLIGITSLSVRTTGYVALTVLISLLIIGTITFRYMMDWSWAEAFYFSVATLSTVGYGDLAPETDAQRICVSIYILVGVTIAAGSIGILGANYLQRREERFLEHVERVKESVRDPDKLKRLKYKLKDDVSTDDDEE
jgi:hypothetical protein